MFMNILGCLLYLMQNPVIKKLFKNRRELSVLGLRIHTVKGVEMVQKHNPPSFAQERSYQGSLM